MRALTERARRTLEQVKWTDQYAWDVDRVAQRFATEGFVIHGAAHNFLTRFGGLYCHQPSPYQPGRTAWHTDAEEAVVRISPADLTQHEQQLSARLTPIGESGFGWFTVVMDETGVVHALDQHLTLAEWSETGEQLFDLLSCAPLTEPAYGSPAHVREWRAMFKPD